jgi:DNA-binding MarR family transcriptional regulator
MSKLKRKELVEQIFLSIGILGRGICAKRESIFAEHNLSAPQTELIFILFTEEKMGMTDLADRLFITKGALSQLVNSLERKGLVVRASSDPDRRARTISLTEKTKSTLEQTHEMQYQKMQFLFDGFTYPELCDLDRKLKEIKEKIYSGEDSASNRCIR